MRGGSGPTTRMGQADSRPVPSELRGRRPSPSASTSASASTGLPSRARTIAPANYRPSNQLADADQARPVLVYRSKSVDVGSLRRRSHPDDPSMPILTSTTNADYAKLNVDMIMAHEIPAAYSHSLSQQFPSLGRAAPALGAAPATRPPVRQSANYSAGGVPMTPDRSDPTATATATATTTTAAAAAAAAVTRTSTAVRSSSRSSILSVNPALLDSVETFSIGLGIARFTFAKRIRRSQLVATTRRPIPTSNTWSYSVDSSSSSSANSSRFAEFAGSTIPTAIILLDESTGRCRMTTHEANKNDLRSAVEVAFSWRALSLRLNPRLPLHPDEIDIDLQSAMLSNAWSTVLDAIYDALTDIASLEYNRELSDAYEPDNNDSSKADNDKDSDRDSVGGESIFSTSYETLSKGLILTKEEISLLEYSVNKKCQTLCGVIATLSTSAAILSVRIAYESRAGNEVDMKKGDIISLWWNFDDVYGFGLNRNNGQVGFINLGHLDQRRLAICTQPPPIPIFSPAKLPEKLPTPQSIHLPLNRLQLKQALSAPLSSGNPSIEFTPIQVQPPQASQANSLSPVAVSSPIKPVKLGAGGPVIPLPGPPPFNPPASVVQQYQLRLQQQQQQQQQQQSSSSSNAAPILPRPVNVYTPPSTSHYMTRSPSLPLPQPKPQRYQQRRDTTAVNNSSGGASTGDANNLRISDRLAARQVDAERYYNMESELDSILSSQEYTYTFPAASQSPSPHQRKPRSGSSSAGSAATTTVASSTAVAAAAVTNSPTSTAMSLAALHGFDARGGGTPTSSMGSGGGSSARRVRRGSKPPRRDSLLGPSPDAVVSASATAALVGPSAAGPADAEDAALEMMLRVVAQQQSALAAGDSPEIRWRTSEDSRTAGRTWDGGF
ncbi:hypothetical protein HDU84_003405 [Entophlyctis sp. JEL0112]|nr:hypothetical protein HDU84_003405 [Entophlyctis sp. JEL0112]